MADVVDSSTAHDHDRCIEDALRAADDVCAERGTRLTELRRRVLKLVWSDHAAVKAYDLLDRLGPGTKPPTVYRALDFLVKNGLVHRIESLNAFVGCPSPDHAHQGKFLICDDCGTVSEIDQPDLGRIIAEHAAAIGFAPERQTVEVHGRCQSCAMGPA